MLGTPGALRPDANNRKSGKEPRQAMERLKRLERLERIRFWVSETVENKSAHGELVEPLERLERASFR